MGTHKLGKAELALAYISLYSVPKDSPEYEERSWVFDVFVDLCRDDPDLTFEVILDVLRLSDNAGVIGSLAAGPMEDLLVEHGDKIIARVEQEAKRNPKMATLLGGVWQNAMSDEIWKRVEAARSHRW